MKALPLQGDICCDYLTKYYKTNKINPQNKQKNYNLPQKKPKTKPKNFSL